MSSKRLLPSRNEHSAMANAGPLTRYSSVHRPQHEMQSQAQDLEAPRRHDRIRERLRHLAQPRGPETATGVQSADTALTSVARTVM